MGKAIVIQGGQFGPNAIYSGGHYIYVNNSYTWGKGGINTPGVSSGSTNPVMSMVGLPLEQANEGDLVLFGANGYKINALLTSDVPSPPTTSQYTYTLFNPTLDSITIPSGKYFEISVSRTDAQNADLSDGPSALLLRQEVE